MKQESFLPSDYREVTSSNYMRLQDGTNTFRVLSHAIVGQEYWKIVDGKKTPIRVRQGVAISMTDLNDFDEKGQVKMPKPFWSFVVYNKNESKIQILELTQKTVKTAIKSLIDNPKWGDPTAYDINIVKEGQKFETTYTVTPDPKEELDKAIIKQYEDMNINLEALFDGADPFNSKLEKGEEEMPSF